MALERKWEKFAGGPAKPMGEDVRVTINRKGLIYMNSRAYAAFGRPEAVALYYCREDDAIALEPAYPPNEQNFNVRKKQNGFSVHASTFCRNYNIRVPKTERFIRPDFTAEGQLVLSLRETVAVGGIGKGPHSKGREG